MPTTYTHDLFGRQVYQRLPEQIKEAVKRHGQLYRIGLHGPDILFYHSIGTNKVTKTGTRMHGEKALPFFREGTDRARKDCDEGLAVYLMGFACHFILDSTCHPYIKTITKIVSHGEIEKEFDRDLMLQQGINPYRYYPACCIVPSMENSITIRKVFPEISCRQIHSSLKGMKTKTNLMVYDDNGRKQKVILPLLKLTGLYESIGGNFMKAECEPVCRPILKELEQLYTKALSEAPQMAEAVWNAAHFGDELPARFDRNYK